MKTKGQRAERIARRTVTAGPADGLTAIGAASTRLGVHARTLMAYERMGLVRPARRSRRRAYTEDEFRWLSCLQMFNRRGGISLKGLGTILRFVPCWAIRREIEQTEGSSECCPATYPGASCLHRVHRAYSGEAPEACLTCGIYRANVGAGRSALESIIR